MDILQGRLEDNTKFISMSTKAGVLFDAAAQVGDYVSFKNYRRCAVVIGASPASGTNTIAVTLKQAKTVENSPVTEKALTFTRMKRILPTASEDPVETTVASSTFNTSATAENEMFVIDVDENMLDIANGFDCFRVDMTDPGAVSTPGFILGIMYEPKFKQDPMPAATIN